MSRGLHSRPNPHGGGLTALLAVLIAGAAFVFALSPGGIRSVRLAVFVLALLLALQLVAVSSQQRTLARSLARSQERLRNLEQRTRSDAEELHRRVLDGIHREGQLLAAMGGLSAEIGLLRAALELTRAIPAVPAVPAVAAVPSVQPEPERVPVRVEFLIPDVAAALPEPLPFVPITPVTTWVVREIQVADEPAAGEPAAAVTMRILDLTDPTVPTDPTDTAEPRPNVWAQYARPA